MNKNQKLRMVAAAGIALLCSAVAHADGTRGIGKYPGNPAECYAPTLAADNAYRNVALNRMVKTSSQYDFNLTPQLLTDGLIATTQPQYLLATTNTGALTRRERESGIDGNEYTSCNLMGEKAWLQYQWNNMQLKANKVKIICTVAYNPDQAKGGYAVSVLTNDGTKWVKKAEQKSDALPGKASKQMVSSDPNKQTNTGTLPLRIVELTLPLGDLTFNNLRFAFDMPGAAYWTLTEMKFFNG